MTAGHAERLDLRLVVKRKFIVQAGVGEFADDAIGDALHESR
jgi:hypothetical protein